MTNIVDKPTVVTVAIPLLSKWTDTVDPITYRVIGISAIGIEVRCFSTATGKVWTDRLPRACFGTELIELVTL